MSQKTLFADDVSVDLTVLPQEPGKTRLHRRITVGLIVLLLGLGATRLLTLVLWYPMCGYGDNFDMIKTMAVFDVWPLERVRGSMDEKGAPARRFGFGNFGHECSNYSSQQLLFAPAMAAMRAIDHFAPGTVFDLRAVGFSQALLWMILAVCYCVRFYRRGHPRAAVLNAAIFALLITDPFNTLYLNSLYLESSSVLFTYFAVLAGFDLCLAGPTLACSILFAVAVTLLGTSKQQHLPTALIVGLYFFLANWYCSARLGRTLAISLTLAVLSIATFSAWNWSRSDWLTVAMNNANSTDSILSGVLPLTKDPARAVRKLGLPDDYVAYVGKTWFDVPVGVARPWPKVFEVSRLRFLPLFVEDPRLLCRLLRKGFDQLDSSPQGAFGPDGLLLTFLGYSEDRIHHAVPMAGLSDVFLFLGRPAFHLLVWLPLVVVPLLVGRRILRFRGERKAGTDLLVILCGTLAYACILVAILGAGYGDFGRHNHLATNLLLAFFIACVIDVPAWFGLGRMVRRRVSALPHSADALVAFGTARPGGRRSFHVPAGAAATASLAFLLLTGAVVIGLARMPATGVWDPTRVDDRIGSCGAVEEAALTRRGGVRMAGWAYHPQTGRAIHELVLVHHGRILPAVFFHADCPQAPKQRQGRGAGWVVFIPKQIWDRCGDRPEVFAALGDGRFGKIAEARNELARSGN